MTNQEFNATPIEDIIAACAFAKFPSSVGLDLLAEVIVSTPYSNIAEFQGTRAALEGEGVIPATTKWPKGFDDLYWEDDKFRYWLRRVRPEGVKGARKQLLDMDWWMFRCDPVNAKSLPELNLERKAKELADEIYRQSAKGRAERNKQWDAYWKAKEDERFQAFKSMIPGINRPKRGRKLKTAKESSTSQN